MPQFAESARLHFPRGHLVGLGQILNHHQRSSVGGVEVRRVAQVTRGVRPPISRRDDRPPPLGREEETATAPPRRATSRITRGRAYWTTRARARADGLHALAAR